MQTLKLQEAQRYQLETLRGGVSWMASDFEVIREEFEECIERGGWSLVEILADLEKKA